MLSLLFLLLVVPIYASEVQVEELVDSAVMRNALTVPDRLLGLMGEAYMSPSGEVVVSVEHELGSLSIIFIDTDTCVELNQSYPIRFLSFDSSGERCVFACGRTASVVDARSGDLIRTLTHKEPVEVTLLGDIRLLAITDDFIMHVWDLENGVEIATFPGYCSFKPLTLFNRDGDRVLTVTRGYGLMSVDDAKNVVIFKDKHEGKIVSLSYNSAETLVVTASADNMARIWNIDRCTSVLLAGHTDALVSARFSPKDDVVVTASCDGAVKLWDLEGTCLSTFNHGDKLFDASINNDGTLLLSASSDKVMVWEIASGEPVLYLGSDAEVVYQTGFIGERAYTVSEDGMWKLWKVEAILRSVAELTHEQLLFVANLMQQKSLLDVQEGEYGVIEVGEHQAIFDSLPVIIKGYFMPLVCVDESYLEKLKKCLVACCRSSGRGKCKRV